MTVSKPAASSIRIWADTEYRLMRKGSDRCLAERGVSTPPGITKRKPNAAFEGHRQRVVVRAHLLSAEVLFELVDSGVFRHGCVLEEAPPVVARYSHLLELQHFLPMKPAIGAPDQGAVIALLVSETRTRVLEPGGFSAGEVGVPNQGLAVPTGRGEHELTGLAGGKQDRKSTRLNSSHLVISYAVFCLKKKKLKIHDKVL